MIKLISFFEIESKKKEVTFVFWLSQLVA